MLAVLAFGQAPLATAAEARPANPASVTRSDVTVTPRSHSAWEAFEQLERRGGPQVTAFGGWRELLVPAELRFEPVKGPRLVAAVAEYHGLQVTWLREGGLAVLGRRAPEAAVKQALAGLKSPEPAVRREAAWLAAWLEDVRVVEPLLAACSDTDAKTAWQAMRSARWLGLDAVAAVGGEKAVEPLLKLEDSPDIPWRQLLDVPPQVAGALGWAGGEKAVTALERLAREELFARSIATDALARIGSEKAKALLLKLAGDADADVRSSAALALDWVGGEWALAPLEKLAGDTDWNVRASAADALGRVGGERAPVLLEKLVGDTDGNVRRSAALALGRVGGERSLALLEKLADDTNRDVRWGAVDAIGWAGGEKAKVLLLKLAEDAERIVSGSAIEALSRASGREALPSLQKFAGHADWRVRSSTADALGELGGERAVALLGKLAGDTDKRVRWSAARALGRAGNRKAMIPLEELAGDADASVRAIAAHALGQVGGEKAVSLLETLAGDAVEDVRRTAVCALCETGGEKARSILLGRLTEEKERSALIVIADCLRICCPGDPAVQKMLEDLKLPDYRRRLPEWLDAVEQSEKQ
jgi:HEAT repeat protein